MTTALLASPVAITLFSAIVGALLTMCATYVADRRRWQREDSTRFDAIREHAYADFLGQVARAQFTPWILSGLPKENAAALWQAKGLIDLHSDAETRETVDALIRLLERPPANGAEEQFVHLSGKVLKQFRVRVGLKEAGK